MQTQTEVPTALYVRMSQDRAGAGLGVQRQEQECRDLAERLGLAVAQVYVDNDMSASTGKTRPGYEALLAAIERREIGAVVVWHIDRLTRRTTELERYIEKARSVPTYSVQGGSIDLATPTGRATAKTVGAWAQHETELKSERQRAKNRQVAASGRMPDGGPIPYGYKADRKTLHPKESEVVREAYRRILSGDSLGSIIRDFNGRGIPTARGGRWSHSTLTNVVGRPLNAGLTFYDGAILHGVKALWEPIVSEEDYYALKAVLAAPGRRTTTGRAKAHLLAGLVRCGSCNKVMQSGRVNRAHRIYRCNNHACTRKVHVAMDALHQHFIERFIAERGDRLQVREEVRGDIGTLLVEVDHKIRATTSKMAETDADVEALVAQLQDLKAQRAELAASPTTTFLVGRRASTEWAKAETIEERQRVITAHMRTLTVAPRGGVTHRFDSTRVEVEWVEEPTTLPDGTILLSRIPEGAPLGTGLVGRPILIAEFSS